MSDPPIPVKILVDSNEPDNLVTAIKIAQLPYAIQKLEVGDYQIGHILIERKTINDFYNSVRDGRLWNQLYNLYQASKEGEYRGLLVVIGAVPTYDFFSKKPMSREKYLYFKRTLDTIEARAPVSYGIPLIRKTCENDFVDFLKNILLSVGKLGKSKKPVLVKKELRTLEEIRSDMLCAVPGIGRDSADILAKNYTIADLVNMSMKQLEDVEVGKKRLGGRSTTLHQALTLKHNGSDERKKK